MRIELPSPTWADTHRAQDDAHTLTLPDQRTVLLGELPVPGEAGAAVRLEVAAQRLPVLTLTF